MLQQIHQKRQTASKVIQQQQIQVILRDCKLIIEDQKEREEELLKQIKEKDHIIEKLAEDKQSVMLQLNLQKKKGGYEINHKFQKLKEICRHYQDLIIQYENKLNLNISSIKVLKEQKLELQNQIKKKQSQIQFQRRQKSTRKRQVGTLSSTRKSQNLSHLYESPIYLLKNSLSTTLDKSKILQPYNSPEKMPNNNFAFQSNSRQLFTQQKQYNPEKINISKYIREQQCKKDDSFSTIEQNFKKVMYLLKDSDSESEDSDY